MLEIGNFLNHGSRDGNAAGYQLETLLRLGDTRAPQAPGTTLLHFLVQVCVANREAALLEHNLREEAAGRRPVTIPAQEIAQVSAAAMAYELEEASNMARSRDESSLAPRPNGRDNAVVLSALMAKCPGSWRLRKMAQCTLHTDQLREMTNQVFESATDAELAVRDIHTGEHVGDAATSSGKLALRSIAERVEEPQAVLILSLEAGQALRWVRLHSGAINNGDIKLDEAARLLSFPWVVPIGTNSSLDQPNGLLMLEQTGVVRDKLRLTDAVRIRYGAKPRPAVAPEDLAHFKRDVQAQLTSLKADLTASLTEAMRSFTPVAATQGGATEPAPSPAGLALALTSKVLGAAMRKRRIEALSWD